MKIFELQNNLPVVTTEGIMSFRDLYDRDTTPSKSRFYQELEFVYFYTDYKSYYNSYPPEEKEAQVIKDYIKIPNWKPDALVLNALEKIRGYYRSIDFSKRTVKGESVFKVKEVTSSIADISKMIESLDKLTQKVQKEEELNVRTRGNETGGFFEDR